MHSPTETAVEALALAPATADAPEPVGRVSGAMARRVSEGKTTLAAGETIPFPKAESSQAESSQAEERQTGGDQGKVLWNLLAQMEAMRREMERIQ